MKNYQLLITVSLICLCACSENNNPQDPSTESGYRLDSMINYEENNLTQKLVYYYSNNYKYYDYSHSYVMSPDEGWVLSSQATYKYDKDWNIIELTSSYYEEGKWIPNLTQYADYGVGAHGNLLIKGTYIFWDKQGNETSRSETQEEFDSLGNVILRITETYLRGNKMSYDADSCDHYYTNNYLDSTYGYRKTNPQDSFTCQGKTIYPKQDGSDILIEYNYNDGKFIPASKKITQFDMHGGITLIEYYKWKNEEWNLSWTWTYSNKYYLDTDLIEESSVESTDYFDNGDVTNRKHKAKYYYTKY